MQYDFSGFIQLENAIKFVNVACTHSHFIVTINKCNDYDKRHYCFLI